ncbi:MAG: PQ-loop domain-containing transporter [Bacteroidales bacterium]|jgi:uncharacterized protein with PQ loop repeat|nr:PQ-loop domain-containing transporter [Bacteroidales bacterium]
MNEYIGWIGSIFFAICALPQVVQTFRTKSAKDLNSLFLLLWLLGEIFTFWYVLYDDFSKKEYHYPLYFNYVFNLLMLVYLVYAKITYKDITEKKPAL